MVKQQEEENDLPIDEEDDALFALGGTSHTC